MPEPAARGAMAAAASIPPSGDVADEDREIYQNLARLQKIHQQVLQLRTLLPDALVEPGSVTLDRAGKTASPQTVASAIKKAAVRGSNSIKSFQAEYESDEMKALWQSAVSSAELSQGHDVWTHDYSEMANTSQLAPTTSAAAAAAAAAASIKPEPGSHSADTDDRASLDKFASLHPGVKTTPVNEGRVLPLKVDVDGLGFLIRRTESDHRAGGLTMGITDDDKSAFPEVREAVARVSEEGELRGLDRVLGLVASYKGYKSRPCQKCGKVFDANLRLAVYRRLGEAGSGDAKPDWEPVHHSCI